MAANPQTKPIDLGPPKIGSYCPHPPSPLLLLLSPYADTHFTIPQRVEDCVDLGTAVKVHSPCPRLYIAAAVAINTSAHGVLVLIISFYTVSFLYPVYDRIISK